MSYKCGFDLALLFTFIFDHCLQLLFEAFMPATNVQMQRDVAARLLINNVLPVVKR